MKKPSGLQVFGFFAFLFAAVIIISIATGYLDFSQLRAQGDSATMAAFVLMLAFIFSALAGLAWALINVYNAGCIICSCISCAGRKLLALGTPGMNSSDVRCSCPTRA